MDKEKRQLLEMADWKRITLVLRKYAKFLVGSKKWRTGSGNMLPKGKSCDDLVQEAIAQALDESRKWDNKRIELLTFLKGTVRSLVSHLVESDDNTKTVEHHEPGQRVDDQPGRDGGEQWPADPSPNPEELAVAQEEQEALIRAYELVLEEVKSRPELEDVTLCLMDGKHKPQDIADELGIDIKKVYQLKRQSIDIMNKVAATLNPMPMKGVYHGKR